MLQLSYISSAIPGAMTAASFEELLLLSRRKNLAAGVTGLLVYDGVRFLQALEGDEQDVRSTFDRIKADARHRAVVVLSRRDIQQRAFGPWQMAAKTTLPRGAGGSLSEVVERLTQDVPDRNAQALFRSFAKLERSAA